MLLYTLIKLLFTNPVMFLVAILLLIVPLLISIAFHELAHGYVAYIFGDPTPKRMGRLTMNPFAHLDPVGTLMLFIIGIGWAKPIIINPDNIQGKTRQMLVALAGPAANLLLAIVFTFVLAILAIHYPDSKNPIIGLIALLISLVVRVNMILAMFNMLPIPPLDGSKVLAWMLPSRLSEYYLRLEPYGMFILLLIIFTVGFKFIFDTAVHFQELLFDFVFKLLT